MKITILKILLLLFLFNSNLGFSQEWKNLKTYTKETGNTVLKDGCWLKKDRKKKTSTWKNAIIFNLENNAFFKYKTIHQIRDFYNFIQLKLDKKGHDIKWTHAAFIIANQLSKLEIGFIKYFIVRNKEIEKFASEGSKKVFEFSFPKLREIYFSKELLKGSEAENWDNNQAFIEQCKILEPLYNQLSKKALKKLQRMAKGKGIYSLAVTKGIKYEGEISDCNARYNYSINKLIPYCNTIN